MRAPILFNIFSKSIFLIPVLVAVALAPHGAAAQPKAKAETKAAAPADGASTGAGGGERVSVEAIKEKYWARGDESEIGVVQNRLYSKEKRFQISLQVGTLISDPFVSTGILALGLGYNFSEYVGVHLIGMKMFSGPSQALTEFRNRVGAGATTNFNTVTDYMGIETNANLLYGKLSLVGKSIIYFDMYLIAGIGRTRANLSTAHPIFYPTNGPESGERYDHYLTPSIGVGQQIHFSKLMSMRIDYRLLYFKENVVEKVETIDLGESLGTRNNFNNVISVGVNFLFGGGGR